MTIIITSAAKVIQFTFRYVNIRQGNIKFALYSLFSTLNSLNVAQPFTQLSRVIQGEERENGQKPPSRIALTSRKGTHVINVTVVRVIHNEHPRLFHMGLSSKGNGFNSLMHNRRLISASYVILAGKLVRIFLQT